MPDASKRVIGAVAVLESGRDCSTPLEPLGGFCPPACLEVNIVGGRHTDVDPGWRMGRELVSRVRHFGRR